MKGQELELKLEKKARESAKELREKWGILENEIIDIRSLVKSKDFLLLYFPNKFQVSGIYLEKKDRDKSYRCIYINTNEPLGRQNFSIAHEIYHAYFEKSVEGVCFQDKRNKDPIEKTAEKFASNILIPKKLLIEQINKKNKARFSLYDIIDIQKVFNVSFQAIIYAINELIKDNQKICIENISVFYKYYNNSLWNRLSEKTLLYDSNILLNTPDNKYYFPEEFKKNLIGNFYKGKIELDYVNEIFDFFNEKINL